MLRLVLPHAKQFDDEYERDIWISVKEDNVMNESVQKLLDRLRAIMKIPEVPAPRVIDPLERMIRHLGYKRKGRLRKASNGTQA